MASARPVWQADISSTRRGRGERVRVLLFETREDMAAWNVRYRKSHGKAFASYGLRRRFVARTLRMDAGVPGMEDVKTVVLLCRPYSAEGTVAHELFHAAFGIAGRAFAQGTTNTAWEEAVAARLDALVDNYWRAWWKSPIAPRLA